MRRHRPSGNQRCETRVGSVRVIAAAFLILSTACSDNDVPGGDAGGDANGADIAIDASTHDGPARDAGVDSRPDGALDGPGIDGPPKDASGDVKINDTGTLDQKPADSSQADLLFDASSPSGTWAVKAGGSAISMGVDAAKNTYIVGKFWTSATFGSTTLTATGTDGQLFLAKLDPKGGFVWAKKFVAPGGVWVGGLAVDGAGNSYVTAEISSAASWGSTNLSAGGFVGKVSSSGAFGWASQVQFPTTMTGSRMGGVAVDSSGNIYITGGCAGNPCTFGSFTLTKLGSFVAKLSPSGAFVWAKLGGKNRGESIAVDGGGNVYVAGHFFQSTKFDTISLTGGTPAGNWSAVFIAKLNAAGTTWSWAVTGKGTVPGAIVVDSTGNSYVAEHGPWLSKINTSGTYIWSTGAKTTNGTTSAKGVVIDSAGNSYITGAANASSVKFGIFTLQGVKAGSTSSGRIFVARLDSSGKYTWVSAPEFSGSSPNKGRGTGNALAIGSANVLHLAGSFQFALKFGNTVLDNPTTYPTTFAATLTGSGAF